MQLNPFAMPNRNVFYKISSERLEMEEGNRKNVPLRGFRGAMGLADRLGIPIEYETCRKC